MKNLHFCPASSRCEFVFVSAEFQEIDHASWGEGGDPLPFRVMRKIVGCERFREGSPVFFVVLCDDVVRELFASGGDEASRSE